MRNCSQFFKIFVGLSLLVILGANKLAAQEVTFTQPEENLGIITTSGMFGCAWGDYDSDGDLDLFISGTGDPNVLYENDEGEFIDVTVDLGVADDTSTYGCGATWADFDNDGDLDLLYMNNGIRLFRNDESEFTLISEEAGLKNFDNGLPLWQGTWGDYDKDGDLDLAYAGGDQGVGGFENPYARILRNDDGVFSDKAPDLLGEDFLLESWNPEWVDYDNDGDLDLWLPTMRTSELSSRLFENAGQTFNDVAEDLDLISFAAIASSWADFDNDGDMDLFIITWTGGGTGEDDMLYQNNGDGFEDIAGDLGLAGPAGDARGLCWGDYDNDGDQDLLIGSRNGNQKLYQNSSSGTEFEEVGEATGAGVLSGDCRNIMFIDYDGDGFLDIFCNSATKTLLHNDGNSNHWIGIKPRGTTSNRDGIGARVRVVTGSLSQIRDIQGGGAGGLRHGYLSAHFGLGDATKADSVIISWPTGGVNMFTDVLADSYYVLVEDTATVGIQENRIGSSIPTEYALSQNYPNPFNPVTTIPFQLPEKSHVRLVLINVLGNVVQEITNREYNAGHYEITLDIGHLATGLYFYKIEAGGFADVKKLAIVK